MPRPGPRRAMVGVRLSAEGIAAVDAMADKRGVTRSEMIRLMLRYAQQHMPTSNTPGRGV